MSARRSLRALPRLFLAVVLLSGGCGWVSRPRTAPGLPTSEVAREAALKAEAAEASPAPPPPAVQRAAPRPEAPDVLDRVIAVVNNDVITLSELQDNMAYYLYESKEAVKPGEEQALKERLLNRMIDSRLQLQEATREQVTVEDAEMNEQMADVMKRVNATTPEEFERIVKAQGLSVEGVKKRIREQILVQKVVRRKVGLRVSVTEQEIEQYVAQNREKLETGLSYRARHILLVPDPPDSAAGWESARVRAEEVWAKVRAGEDFAALAGRYSQDATAKDGGDLGVLKQGELAADIEGQILRLRPGDASAPYRSRLGYHLFKLEWKEGLTGDALAHAKEQIGDILLRQKYAARLQAWLAEIRRRAVIEIRL